MTVTATSYCSLEEAWGTAPVQQPPIARKKKLAALKAARRPPPPPACPSHLPLDQNARPTDEFSELYDKKPAVSSHRLPSADNEDDVGDVPYEEASAGFLKQFENQLPDVVDTAAPEPVAAPVQAPASNRPTEKFTNDNSNGFHHSSYTRHARRSPVIYDQRSLGSSLLDLFLYIVSGVLLIFVMDQFVQLGQV